jgi:serine/threonine-protein kinase
VGRFEREVAATVSLSHPNTIRILDHGISDDGIRFYAMELLRGRDVGTAVNADGPLPVDRAAYLLRQVAHSLAEAHAKGIYHRDVKPENIFITNDGRYWDFVKVLDFGIARVVGGGAGAGLTKLG